MRVVVNWEKRVFGTSTVTIPSDGLAKYADGEPISADVVKDYLDAGDASDWADQVKPRDGYEDSATFELVSVEMR